MTAILDDRFKDVPFCKDLKILFPLLVKEKDALDSIEYWNKQDFESIFNTYSGGTSHNEYLDWTYQFSPNGLTIQYSIFHEIMWDDSFKEFDYEDSCDLTVFWSKKDLEILIEKSKQLSLF